MFVGISNTPRDYAWGSPTAIAELLGTEPSGRPEAELWLGTHPGSPALTADGKLSDIVTLPFLLKVLAAASPLSLQAHPNSEQAKEGYARENAAGVPLDAPHRNYKDECHKPELIFALSDEFRALCGFRPASATSAAIERLLTVSPGNPALIGWLDRLGSDAQLRPTFEWLVSGGDDVVELIDALVAAAAKTEGEHFTLIERLATHYPADPGIAVSLMLNLVVLQRGEVLYLPAGNIHAYVEGLGIELMAASDNVLRGGLTPKHIDIGELTSVVDFTPLPVPRLDAFSLAEGIDVFSPGIPDFELVHFSRKGVVPLDGPAIALCIDGSWQLRGALGSASISRGESLFVSGDEAQLAADGTGELFVATVGSQVV
jgi:mannose-6-phosphate isomerase